MLCLRWLLFVSPVLMALPVIWLYGQVSHLRLPTSGPEMVYVISEPVGYLNPLVPQTGVTGEIVDLVFEPLLKLEGGAWQANLIERWTYQTVVTVRCSSEEAAGELEASVRAEEALPAGTKAVGVDRVDTVLTVALEGEKTAADAFIQSLPASTMGNYDLIRIRVQHSAPLLLETFLSHSVEKEAIRMLDYESDQVVNLFVAGNADAFLEELKLHYEANGGLNPLIETVKGQAHTSTQIVMIDLRREVVWHDGEPLDVDDVIFSYERLTDPGSPLPLAAHFAYVSGMEKQGSHRLKVICNEIPARFLDSWARLPVLPQHVLEVLSPDAEADPFLNWESFFVHPVGLGPYQVTERSPEGGLSLTAHPDYFRGAPQQEQIHYQLAKETEQQLLALRRGQIDLIEVEPRLESWLQRHAGVIEMVRGEPQLQTLVAWNVKDDLLGLEQLRRALAMSLDLNTVLSVSAHEYVEPVTGLFRPLLAEEARADIQELYDPAQAESLFAEVGFGKKDSEGFRVNAEGERLAFRLTVNLENNFEWHLAQRLVDEWAMVGVEVTVEPMRWRDILTKRLSTRDFEAVLLEWQIPNVMDGAAVWHSAAADTGGNFFGLTDDTTDRLLDRLAQEQDVASAVVIAEELEQRLRELQPSLLIAQTGRLLGVRKNGVSLVTEGSGERVILDSDTQGAFAARASWVTDRQLSVSPVDPSPNP